MFFLRMIAAAEPDLADEVRDDRAGIGLLHLGRQMALCHPGGAEAEPVRELDLLEEVREHRPLVGDVAIDLGLADREEDVEFHAGDIMRASAY